MKGLIEILNKFDDERSNRIKAHTWNEDAVAECFKDCATKILCNGYFLVNNEYIIDLGAIELYYHEEGKSKIKDYAMYHIPERYKYPKTELIKIANGINTDEKTAIDEIKLPYFKFGSFNFHQSGVDVTFEKEPDNNEKYGYRASFLIRAYRVLVAEKGGTYPKNPDTKYDVHSTHIFDDMFYEGFPTQITWKEYEKGGDIEQDCRKNLKIKKLRVNKQGNNVIENSKEDDTRQWQFKIKGLDVNNSK